MHIPLNERLLLTLHLRALSRSPQLWTSYISHIRDFDQQCHGLQRTREARLARDALKRQSEFLQQAHTILQQYGQQVSEQNDRIDKTAQAAISLMQAQAASLLESTRDQLRSDVLLPTGSSVQEQMLLLQQALQSASEHQYERFLTQVLKNSDDLISGTLARVNGELEVHRATSFASLSNSVQEIHLELQQVRQDSFALHADIDDAHAALHARVAALDKSLLSIERSFQRLRQTLALVRDAIGAVVPLAACAVVLAVVFRIISAFYHFICTVLRLLRRKRTEKKRSPLLPAWRRVVPADSEEEDVESIL